MIQKVFIHLGVSWKSGFEKGNQEFVFVFLESETLMRYHVEMLWRWLEMTEDQDRGTGWRYTFRSRQNITVHSQEVRADEVRVLSPEAFPRYRNQESEEEPTKD